MLKKWLPIFKGDERKPKGTGKHYIFTLIITIKGYGYTIYDKNFFLFMLRIIRRLLNLIC